MGTILSLNILLVKARIEAKFKALKSIFPDLVSPSTVCRLSVICKIIHREQKSDKMSMDTEAQLL